MMRLLFLRFPRESAEGGAENQTSWLAEALMEKGHSVEFLGSCSVLLKRFRAKNFTVTSLGIGTPPVTLWSAISFLWRRGKMKKLMTDAIEMLEKTNGKFDAIMMLSLSEKLLITEWAAARGTKVFWIEHDRVGRWLIKNPWLSALKKASEHAAIVCVSELSKKIYADLGFDTQRIVGIANGVPPTPASPNPFSRREKGDRSVMRVGCIARLSPEKGIDILIEAIAQMPEITLRILGKGSEEGYLRQLIAADTERMGGQRITLQNTCDNLSAFYSSLDVLVLPSIDHDPFGLVVAEAMMHGVATVVTDACGIASYLRSDDDTIIVPAGSSSALSVALKTLMDIDVRRRIAEAGRKTALEKFSVEKMVERYENLIKE